MKLNDVIGYITELELKNRENEIKNKFMEGDKEVPEPKNNELDFMSKYIFDLGLIKLAETIYNLDGYNSRIDQDINFKDWLKKIKEHNWQDKIPLNIPRNKILDMVEPYAYEKYQEKYQQYKYEEDKDV